MTYDNENDAFKDILNHILLENYYKNNPQEKRNFREAEIILEEKSKLDTNVLSAFQINFMTLYNMNKEILVEYKNLQEEID